MKKRFLSALLGLCLLMTLLPATALAETIDGVEFVAGADMSSVVDQIDLAFVKNNTVYKAGTGKVLWVPTKDEFGSVNGGTLTLDNVQNTDNINGFFKLPVEATIVLLGENSIKREYGWPLFQGNDKHSGTITIKGSGTIDLTNNAPLIEAGSDVTLEGGERWGEIQSGNGKVTLNNVTIPDGKTLHLDTEEGVPITISNVTVNGTLKMRLEDSADSEVNKERIGGLDLNGYGFVQNTNENAVNFQEFYSTSGEPTHTRGESLDFSKKATDDPSSPDDNSGWEIAAKLQEDGYEFSGNASSGYTLKLGNLVIDNVAYNASPIILPNDGNVTIILEDGTTTRLIATNNSAILANAAGGGTLYNHTIKGNGKLELESGDATKATLQIPHNLTIAGGHIFITNRSPDDGSVGIHQNNTNAALDIIGGKLSITAGDRAIQAGRDIALGSGVRIKTPENGEVGTFNEEGDYSEADISYSSIYSKTDENTKPAKNVVIESANPAPVAPDRPEPSYIPDYNDPLPPVTVYNHLRNDRATVALTGVGLSSSDLLITESNPQGGAYDALMQLADRADIFGIYNIYLRSGQKSIGEPMHLSFDLDAEYAGQDFTLVHEKADTTHEYFYDTADANGDLSFGPLYELSPFLLVKGTLEKAVLAEVPDVTIDEIPKTGDAPQTAALAGVMVIGLLGLAAAIIAKRKRA